MSASLLPRVLPALLLVAVAFSGAAAQVKKNGAKKLPPAAMAALQETNAIRVTVTSLAPNGTLTGPPQSPRMDLGNVAYGKKAGAPGVTLKHSRGALVVSTRFGLLLQDVGGRNFRTATVRAFVTDADSRKTYAIDGIRLTTTPQVISTSAPIGIVSAHRLQVSVPASEAPGPVTNEIGFLVTPN